MEKKLCFQALEETIEHMVESGKAASSNHLTNETFELAEERRRNLVLVIQNGQLKMGKEESDAKFKLMELTTSNSKEMQKKEAALWAREQDAVADKVTEMENSKFRELKLKDDVISQLHTRIKMLELSNDQSMDWAKQGQAMLATQLNLNAELKADNDSQRRRLNNRSGGKTSTPPTNPKNSTTPTPPS